MAINSLARAGLPNTNTKFYPAAVFSNTPTGSYTDSNGISWSYVMFTSNGTLTFTTAGLADMLIVAGGGGSGNNYGSGGGAGGVLELWSIPVNATSYAVTVGGAGATLTNGSNSSVGALGTAIGGGRGTSQGTTAGSGGSGGGGSRGSDPGTGTQNQGSDGGLGNDGFNFTGGGGGAGGGPFRQVGGDGRVSTITGSSVTYAVGGDGVVYGGGGSATNSAYGSGGGAESKSGTAGVVIVRVRTN